MHVALWEPEIPPNTGNIARLCTAVGARLHLIGRLGFRLDEKALRRAGCDYWPTVDVAVHVTFEKFLEHVPAERIWLIDNPAPTTYTKVKYADGDCLLFGNESSGVPASIRERFAGRLLAIPMPTGNVRSLNLATAAGIVLYEALRQQHDW
jgi:tRNA (cytidine/uridine-2'-O-)-methyltransferase